MKTVLTLGVSQVPGTVGPSSSFQPAAAATSRVHLPNLKVLTRVKMHGPGPAGAATAAPPPIA